MSDQEKKEKKASKDTGIQSFIQDIGTKLCAIRKERGVNLKFLSERTGLSVPLLSQIENGKTNVSVKNLKKITTVLGVDMQWVFAKPEYLSSFRLTRKIEFEKGQATFFDGHRAYEVAEIGPIDKKISSRRTIDIYTLTLENTPPPSEKSLFKWNEGEGEVDIVLKGIVLLYLGSDVKDLQVYLYLYPGDVIEFHSGTPHYYQNITETSELMICKY